MPMAGDNNKDKKGFSGLSDLASEVSGIDEPIKPEPKAEAKPQRLSNHPGLNGKQPLPNPSGKQQALLRLLKP